jgi:hypothetical protein
LSPVENIERLVSTLPRHREWVKKYSKIIFAFESIKYVMRRFLAKDKACGFATGFLDSNQHYVKFGVSGVNPSLTHCCFPRELP